MSQTAREIKTTVREDRSERAREAIEAINHHELNEEIEYRLGVQADSGHEQDYYQALLDAEEFAENTSFRRLLTPARRALIKMGMYREITNGELARIQTLGGRRKYDFALDRKKWVWDYDEPSFF